MILSDTAVRRPVFAAVISLLLVAFGIVSFNSIPVREYPDIDPPIVSIDTSYPGAAAATVETRITQLIEDRVAGIEGTRSITSSSSDGQSEVTIEFDLNRDVDDAANDVRDRISGVVDNLPEEADPPDIRKADSSDRTIMWLNLVSDRLDRLELTDYARRQLVDRLSVVDGVARVRVGGALDYAMRIWLDRKALAARQLTAGDVEQALRRENVEFPAGSVRSEERDFVVRLERSYYSEQDFRDLVIREGAEGYLVRLGDVARVELEAEESRQSFRGNGVPMIGLGIIPQSKASTLAVGRAVKEEVKRIEPGLPAGVELKASFDSTVFVETAIKEVYRTLFIAAGLVVLVILVFLGDWRAMLVPAVTVPVSLIATFTVLYFLDYSINLLTLLAMVLAIGLVVDDAIVVLENIHRRVARGESALVASYLGARQVGFAVVATTAVLVAVFLPITFLRDNVGRLFGEFAVAITAAVIFSSIVALTLSPAMCSKLLSGPPRAHRIDALFGRLRDFYAWSLGVVLHRPAIAVAIIALVCAGIYGLLRVVPSEFAPREDRGILFMPIQAPDGASFDFTMDAVMDIEQRIMPLVENGEIKRLLLRAPSWGGGESFNSGIGIIVLSDWGERRPASEIARDIAGRIADVTSVRAFPIMPRSLGGRFGKPVEFVLGGGSYDELAQWRDILLEKVAENPNLTGVDHDYRETKPQLRVSIDRERAGDLGVSVSNIGRTLETLMGYRRVTTFLMDGEEYDVILEGMREDKQTPLDMANIYVRSDQSGRLVPLANLISIEESADAGTLNRYNRVRAITIEADLVPGYSLDEALVYLEELVRTELPSEASYDYKGESLELRTSGQSIYLSFALALLVVFLVLSAQFESFVHPLIIMLTVPLAIVGALLGLFAFGQTLNIYSQIGIIILVGLATKNGILIVEFANQLRRKGLDEESALIEAASLRLRPIFMTAITTVMGAVPLVLSSGAGSESRSVIGIVIISGVSVATVLTLLVIPVAYHWFTRRGRVPGAVGRQLDSELSKVDSPLVARN